MRRQTTEHSQTDAIATHSAQSGRPQPAQNLDPGVSAPPHPEQKGGVVFAFSATD